MDKNILIGTIGKARGVSGEFFIYSFLAKITELPENFNIKIGYSESFSNIHKLEYIDFPAPNKFVGKIKGINSKEEITEFKEQGIFASLSEILKSNPDFYMIDDILDCQVRDVETQEIIGHIIEVWDMPANDVWLIETKDGDLPVPVVESIVKNVDFENKTVDIFMMEGLRDLLHASKDSSDED